VAVACFLSGRAKDLPAPLYRQQSSRQDAADPYVWIKATNRKRILRRKNKDQIKFWERVRACSSECSVAAVPVHKNVTRRSTYMETEHCGAFA